MHSSATGDGPTSPPKQFEDAKCGSIRFCATATTCGVVCDEKEFFENKSADVIFHLTHLGMATECGSRAPHLDTALMGSPLVLTQERRPPEPFNSAAYNIFRSVETREERGSYGASGALLTYFHLDVDLVLRNEPREALSMGADVQKRTPTSLAYKKTLLFFIQDPFSPNPRHR